MAIFEKSSPEKEYLDDTAPLSCSFLNSRIINGHTEYVIRVQRGVKEEDSWIITKRYKEFLALHYELQAFNYGIQLPPKKYIGNLRRQFVVERQALLQKYMQEVTKNLILASNVYLRKFLDPENYSSQFHMTAVQNASMALRDKPEFFDLKQLPSIGWRYKKQYCSVQRHRESLHDYLLTWVEYGPDKCLHTKEMQSAFKVLTQLQHPYISSIVSGSCYSDNALVIRISVPKGSLRDIIYDRTPFQPFLKKYSNRKERLLLPEDAVTTISVQVLYALKFLHNKRIPYGNLHSGNVFIEGDVAKISEIENGILGLPSFHRPYIIESYKRVHTIEDMDVYCFGHLLYEMAFGERLENHCYDETPSDCYERFRPVLDLLLSASCKEKLPSVAQLLSHDAFYRCASNVAFNCKPKCKMSNNVKTYFDRSIANINERLRRDQNALKLHKRVTHIQELVDMEETEDMIAEITNEHLIKKKCKVKKTTSELSLAGSSIAESFNSSITSSPASTSADVLTSSPLTSVSTPCDDKENEKICCSPPSSEDAAKLSTSSLQMRNGSIDNKNLELLHSIANFNKNNLRKINTSYS